MAMAKETGMGATYGTLAASRRMRSSGLPMKQADATADVIADAVRGLVTKDHIDVRFSEIDTNFNSMRNEMHARFAELKSHIDKQEATLDMKQWRLAVGIILAQVTVTGLGIAVLTFLGTLPGT